MNANERAFDSNISVYWHIETLLHRTLQMCKKAHDHRNILFFSCCCCSFSAFTFRVVLLTHKMYGVAGFYFSFFPLHLYFLSNSLVSIAYEQKKACMRSGVCVCVLKNGNCELIENYLGHILYSRGFVFFLLLLRFAVLRSH